MSHHVLEKNYRGNHLKLDISREGKTQLFINGLVRDEGASGVSLRLSSVVQTDYEWHELIEGIVNFGSDYITASLFANNTNVAHKKYKLSER